MDPKTATLEEAAPTAPSPPKSEEPERRQGPAVVAGHEMPPRTPTPLAADPSHMAYPAPNPVCMV